MEKRRNLHLIFISALIMLPFFIPAAALADSLGVQRTFNTDMTFDRLGRSSLTATLRTVSDNAYFYIEDKYWDTLSSSERQRFNDELKELATEFETVIYPKERQFWGSEPNPGIDNDPKITILFEDLTQNYGGYFETSNLVTKSLAPKSNEREMFVVGVQALGNNFLNDFLAHEFQHLISYNQKEIINHTNEDVWLNELRSEYSLSLLGYNDNYRDSSIERRTRVFVADPSDSLTEWPNVSKDYSMVALFGEYLVNRFGSSILNETLHYSTYSIPSLNEYLAVRNTNFSEVFMDWMVANYLNDQSMDPKYGYSRSELKSEIKVKPQIQSNLYDNLGYTTAPLLKDWQPYWIEYNLQNITDTKGLKLDLKGSGQNFLSSYIAFYNDGSTVVNQIPVANSRAIGFIKNSPQKKINKVVLMVTNANKVINFEKEEIQLSININADVVDNSVIDAQTLKDGALIKRIREKEIYVVWGKYKRYLHPDVIKLYGHLDPSKAIEVDVDIFNSYQTANYVRNVNEQKVYAVWPDATKHWMNITAQHWDATGRDWNAIFIINDLELNFYRAGADIRQ